MNDFDRKRQQFEQDFERDEKFTRRMIIFGFCATAVFLLMIFALMGAAALWIVSNL